MAVHGSSTRWFRWLRGALLLVLGAVLVLVVTIKVRYGRGTPYPDLSGAPRVPPAEVAAVVTLDFPPGNVTGSRDGRIFFNLHPFALPHRFTDAFLFELVDGKARPYPDVAAQADLRFTFGITVDARGWLWLTSPANLDRERTRLIAFDLATDRKLVDHELPPGVARYGQDLRVTADGKTVLLADTGLFRLTPSSLVVVDTATWQARSLLRDSPATQPQNWVMRQRGAPYRLLYGLLSFQVGLDGIALSPEGRWLYFGAMTHDTLYRVPLSDVLDAGLAPAALAAKVERVGQKPMSDGIHVAADGSVLVTDVEHGGVARMVPGAGEWALSTLVKLDSVVWADGVFSAASGDVYFTDSAIPRYINPLARPPELARLQAARPYHVYRFRMPSGAR